MTRNHSTLHTRLMARMYIMHIVRFASYCRFYLLFQLHLSSASRLSGRRAANKLFD